MWSTIYLSLLFCINIAVALQIPRRASQPQLSASDINRRQATRAGIVRRGRIPRDLRPRASVTPLPKCGAVTVGDTFVIHSSLTTDLDGNQNYLQRLGPENHIQNNGPMSSAAVFFFNSACQLVPFIDQTRISLVPFNGAPNVLAQAPGTGTPVACTVASGTNVLSCSTTTGFSFIQSDGFDDFYLSNSPNGPNPSIQLDVVLVPTPAAPQTFTACGNIGVGMTFIVRTERGNTVNTNTYLRRVANSNQIGTGVTSANAGSFFFDQYCHLVGTTATTQRLGIFRFPTGAAEMSADLGTDLPLVCSSGIGGALTCAASNGMSQLLYAPADANGVLVVNRPGEPVSLPGIRLFVVLPSP